MIAKTWMEVLRLVNNRQGINITELLTHLGETHGQTNRLILTGYLRCMEDIGLLTAERGTNMVQMYTNGSSPSMLIKEFAEFQRMMDAKRRKAKERLQERVRGALKDEQGRPLDEEDL